MYLKQTQYDNSPEFLAAGHYVCFTGTAVNTGIKADTNGKKWILAGTLIDANGKIVTVTGSDDNWTPSEAPVGIVFHTVDVTEGPQPVSIMVEGYVTAERLQGENVADYAKSAAFKTALPEIKVC